MAVEVLVQPVVQQLDNWVTVLVSEGDSAFVQEVANSEQDLFIANNSSFFPGGESPRIEVPDFANNFDLLSVRSGKVVQSASITYPIERERSDVHAIFNVPAANFDLADMDASTVGRIEGEINLGAGRVLTFNNGSAIPPNQTNQCSYTITQNGSLQDQGNLAVEFSDNGGQLLVELRETTSPLKNMFRGVDAPLLVSLSVDDSVGNSEVAWSDSLGSAPVAVLKPSDGIPGNPTPIQIPELVANSGYQYVPGTLSGVVELPTAGRPQFSFQIESADYGQEFESQALGVDVPLSFGVNRAPQATHTHDVAGTIIRDQYTVTGTFNTYTGVITFRTLVRRVVANNVGLLTQIQLPVHLASYSFGGREFVDEAPTDFTLYDGHTFQVGLVAEMVNPRSAISVESPIVTTGSTGGLGKVSLAATEVTISAPVRASRSITVPAARDTAAVWSELWDHDDDDGTPDVVRDDGTVTERLTFEAIVSSDTFEIQVAEDPEALVNSPSSGAWERSQFLVTQTGSMSNIGNVLNTPPQTLPPAGRIFVEVDNGDIFLEGKAVGVNQSYFLRSPVGSELQSPFRLTTESRLTGSPVGRIEGGTVAVTLANDSFGESYDSYAKSFVTLDTDIDRLRVQAAYRGPYGGEADDPLEMPFNYDLTVRERSPVPGQGGNLIVDAIAANSGTLNLETEGTLDLLASIKVESGDVGIVAGKNLTLQAPIQVAYGAIAITAPSIDVNNSVRVVRALQDDVVADVTLKATSGPLRIDDAVTGLNRVVLESEGSDASISGSGSIGGDVIQLNVNDDKQNGNIDIRTAANLVQVRANGETRIVERDTAAFEVRDSSEVTLIANGFDLLDPEPFGPGVSPAIFANIYDTKTLTVSAPNGSVDVRHFGDVSPEIGNIRNITDRTEDSMTAGGSVSIVSDIGSQITVYDAPLATGGAVGVKVATSSLLPGTFLPSAPADEGIRPTYISTKVAVAGNGTLAAFDGIEASELLLGDRVLVKNGVVNASSNANGIYAVLQKRYDTSGSLTLLLVRDTRFDTTAEIGQRFFVRVRDGGSAGKLFVCQGFDFQPGRGLVSLVSEEVEPRQGHVSVTATAVAVDLRAEFVAGASGQDPMLADTITAIETGGIRSFTNRLLFDDVLLQQGDLVLIRNPIAEYNSNGERTGEVVDRAVGIWEVVREGKTQTDGVTPEAWQFRRWQGVNEDGFDFSQTPPGTLDPVYEGVVAVNDGSLRTARTGVMYGLNFRSLNQVGLNFQEIIPPVGGVVPLGTESPYPWQNIETKNPNGDVDFVVSTDHGVNEATGSLGRMLQLAQTNGEFVGRDSIDHLATIGFDASVRSIDLVQELPAIVDPLRIVPGQQVLLDGTGIESNRLGQRVRTGIEQYFVGPARPSQVATARRLVRGAVTEVDRVDGFEIAVSGAVVSNFRIGGFTSGAAIFVNGGENTLIENVILGRSDDAAGSRLPNKFGVEVERSTVGSGEFTTILNSTIVASEEVGVQFSRGSLGVRVVGVNVGQPLASNKTGIVVDTEESREQLIGVLPIPAEALVAKGARFRSEFLIIESADGQADTLTDLVKNIYLGQTILMGASGILPGDAEVASIEFKNNVLKIGLTREILRSVSGDIPLTFLQPPRNSVRNNQHNIVVKSGSVRIVGTDVTNAIRDGIRLEGNKVSVSDGGIASLVREGTTTVGGGLAGDSKELDEDHVTVHSNQNAGIRVAEEFFGHIDSDPTAKVPEKQQLVTAHVIIAGNYLGTNRSGASGLKNGQFGLSDFVVGNDVAVDDWPLKHQLLQDRFRGNPDPSGPERESVVAITSESPSPHHPGNPNYLKYLELDPGFSDYQKIKPGDTVKGYDASGSLVYTRTVTEVDQARRIVGLTNSPSSGPAVADSVTFENGGGISRYKALYRPEDFAAFGAVGFDREGNFHGGGSLGGGDPPPFDPDPPVVW